MVPGHKMFHGLQLSYAKLGIHVVADLLNNVYNMVQHHNSQFLAERLFRIEESIHHIKPRNNIVRQAVSKGNQFFVPELASIWAITL